MLPWSPTVPCWLGAFHLAISSDSRSGRVHIATWIMPVIPKCIKGFLPGPSSSIQNLSLAER